MALIGTISGSFDSTGSFGSVFVTGEVTQSTVNEAIIGRVEAKSQIVAAGTTFSSFTSGTSGTSGATGGAGATGGTGSTGNTGATGGAGGGGGGGGTGGLGSQGAQGGTGGTGAGGGTGGAGGTGGTGGTGGAGAKGDTGGQGGTGGGGAGGATGGAGGGGGGGGTGGTGGGGGQGAQGDAGGQGPAGDTRWNDNEQLTWSGQKTLLAAGNYNYAMHLQNANDGMISKAADRPLHMQNSSGTGLFWFYASGNTSPSTVSDERRKRNIQPLSSALSQSALDEVKKLDNKLYSFTYDHIPSRSLEDGTLVDTEHQLQSVSASMDWNVHTGVVAQDIRDITGSGDFIYKLVHRMVEDEDLVKADTSVKAGASPPSGSYYSLDYEGLTTISTQALIDLTKRVQTLKNRISALEN